MGSAWRRAKVANLGARVDLGIDNLRLQYWRDLSASDVAEVLSLVEAESLIPQGLLRPDDRLHDLFSPPPTRNPLRWLEFQGRSGDGLLEVSAQLSRRLRLLGRVEQWGGKVFTIDELVKAWSSGPTPTGS
jgi:hypothetical protein